MSQSLIIILEISFGMLFVVVLFHFRKGRNWKALIFSLIILGIGAFLLNRYFGFPQPIETYGPTEETIALVIAYLSMLIGMVAQYFYRQAESGRRRFKFRLAPFLMPVLISPIVFIPLLSIIQEMGFEGGAFTKSNIMLYFVAFQNGFFWKEIFERQQTVAMQKAG
jgi:membrane protease YdiL (CAAX protease family)